MMMLADADGEHHAENAAEESERHRFKQKLAHNIFAPRAQSFAHADLFGSFGDAHQHDVHHANAADQQAETGDGDGNQADHRGDAVKLFDKLVGSLDVEVVRIAELHIPPPAQNFF